MVKKFIIESHELKPPIQDENLEDDEDFHGIEPDRPSYIDMERHISPTQESSTSPDDEQKPERRLVDVCLAPHLLVPHWKYW